jgi:hypothetical protein
MGQNSVVLMKASHVLAWQPWVAAGGSKPTNHAAEYWSGMYRGTFQGHCGEHPEVFYPGSQWFFMARPVGSRRAINWIHPVGGSLRPPSSLPSSVATKTFRSRIDLPNQVTRGSKPTTPLTGYEGR